MSFAELLTLAKKVTEYLLDATTTFDSTTAHRITCPAGKRWFVIGGITGRDVSSTLDIVVKNVSDEITLWLEDSAASTGPSAWPSSVAAVKHMIHSRSIILDAGEYVCWAFDVAQATAAYLTYSYLEVDV